MKNFNVAYVKSHPYMFGTIFIVFGLLFWLFLNKGGGSSSGGGYTVQQSGPSEAMIGAQLQAQTQLQLGQLQLAGQAAAIGGQREMAALELSFRVQELGLTHDIGVRTIESSLAALALQTNAQMSIAADNNAFMIDYARVAADSATDQLLIGASLQRDLGRQQLEAYKYGRAIDGIGMLKAKRRDEALTYFLGVEGGDPNAAWAAYGERAGGDGSGGGGLLGSVGSALGGGAIGIVSRIGNG